MVSVLWQEFCFRFKKYWRETLVFGVGYFLLCFLVLAGQTEVERGIDEYMAATLVLVAVLLLHKIVMNMGLYLPNRLHKTMFYLPLSEKDKKKYISYVLVAKFCVVVCFVIITGFLLWLSRILSLKEVGFLAVSELLWGIVTIFGHVQLREPVFGKQKEVKFETYQIVNLAFYILYLVFFLEEAYQNGTELPWQVHLVLWVIQGMFLLYTLRYKAPLVLKGHSYEAVCREEAV